MADQITVFEVTINSGPTLVYNDIHELVGDVAAFLQDPREETMKIQRTTMTAAEYDALADGEGNEA